MSLALEAAHALASVVHKDQKYGAHSYIKHLEDVVAVLVRFQVTDEDILVAGFLHDSIEDTETTQASLEIFFGRRAADLVYRVTNEPGKNRKERHEKTYGKISSLDAAITLKLADRIANLEFSIESKDEGKVKMYTKEYEGFRAKLHKVGTHDAMWRHLDFLIGFEPEPFERSGAW